MKAHAILFLTICSSCAFAQSQFQVAIGGSDYDNVYPIKQTRDTGYIIAGYTGSFSTGIRDMYIVKLDASGGNIQWTKAIGGGEVDIGLSVVQTTDGGYAASGITLSYGAGSRDFFLVKLDAAGNYLWSRTIGGANDEYAYSVIQTADGGYAVGGYTISFGAGGNDMYIVKLDANGTLQWSRTIGGASDDRAYSVVQSPDGGYVLAGYTNSFGAGGIDMYIVKLDSAGNLQWSKTIGGIGTDLAYSMVKTSDGGYALAGRTSSFGAGQADIYIVKLTATGMLQWTRTVGGTTIDFGFSIVQTAEGGFAVSGSTGESDINMYVVKLDSTANLQWSRTIGGTGSDEANSIIQTMDGGYVVAGYTFSFGSGIEDIYIAKLDAGGNTCGNSAPAPTTSGAGGTLGTPASILNIPNSTVTSPASDTMTGGTLTTVCVIGIQPISNEIPQSYKLFQNYPNPFNPKTIINFQLPMFNYVRLVIFDILGREVITLLNEELKPGIYEVQWDAANYPSGVYFYRIEGGDFVDSKKMVLVK